MTGKKTTTVVSVAATLTAHVREPGLIKVGSVFLSPSAAGASASVTAPRTRDGRTPVLTTLGEATSLTLTAETADGTLTLVLNAEDDTLTLEVLEEQQP